MTHANNISVTMRLSFRPFNVRWQIGWAEILGWWDESILGMAIPGKAAPILGITPPDPNALRVRIGVPTPKQYRGLSSDLSSLYGIHPSFELKIDRSCVPSDALRLDETPQNAPDISGRESFAVLAGWKPEFKNLFFPSGLKPGEREKNAWAMESEFVNLCPLESDDFDWAWSLRQFLNKWGLWNYERGYDTGVRLETHPFVLAFPKVLREKQDAFRAALKLKNARKWLSTTPDLRISPINERPYFALERFGCEEAIKATITIHHLANEEFGTCKRNDCRKLFERITQQKRLYCSPKCAHLANVRKLRADARKAKTKSKGAQRNAKG